MPSASRIEILLPELRAYARSVSDNLADADDLVQDAVERTLRTKSHPIEVDDLRPWMFRVIRNLNLDTLRKKKVRMEYSRAQSRLSIDLTQSRDHANDVLVRMTFDKLPAPMREVLFLVDVMGMKYSEAAEVLEVPNGTVMSRVSRARRALIEAMQTEDTGSHKDRSE